MLSINNKFEIGQDVYVVHKCRTKEICPSCKGEGNKIIDGNIFTCQKCYGSGQLMGIKNYQVIGKDTIKRIKIYLEECGGEIKSVVKYAFEDGNDYTDAKLFITEEEAKARCKELNMDDSANGNR